MNNSSNLTNQLLIAMPGLHDDNFAHTATYICEHNEQGAMGIIINRPTSLQLYDILEQMDIVEPSPKGGSEQIYIGGPIQPERGFVLHGDQRDWDSTLHIMPQISITTSRDILQSIINGEGPEEHLIALGYAGWGSGQLEQEIASNVWLSGPANHQILFHTPPEQRWRAAAKLLGVDLNLISTEAGHA